MMQKKKIRDLSRIESFEDIVLAVDQGIFPIHLFKMMEAAGEKNPYKQYRATMKRCYIAAVIFDWVYLAMIITAMILFYNHKSFSHVLVGGVLIVLVVLMIISDMVPHIMTSRRQAEERAKPFLEFFKRLCVERPDLQQKDFFTIVGQVNLAKTIGLIKPAVRMSTFVRETSK